MNNQDDGSVTFALLPGWRKRAKEIKRKYKVSLVRMCRDGLKAQLEHFERLTEEEERKKNERRARRTGDRELRRSSVRLAPERVDISPASVTEDYSSLDPVDALYREHAARILAVLENKRECAARVREAVQAIQARSPLTCPSEEGILTELEKRVVALRDGRRSAPNLRFDDIDNDPELDKEYFDALQERLERLRSNPKPADEMEGTEINATKVRTHTSSSFADQEDEQETP